jgi:hypothetical protein
MVERLRVPARLVQREGHLLALALKHDPLRLPRLALLLALHTCLLGLLKFAELIHALTF